MNIFKTIAVIFFLALMTMQAASAADTTPVEAGGFFDKMDSAVRAVGQKAGRNLGESLATSGYSVAATLKTTALGIAGGLALIYLFHEVLQFISGQRKSIVQVLFDIGIPCIFAAAFITQYPILLPKFEKILDVFRHLASGGEDPFNLLLNVYTTVIGKVTSAIGGAFKDVGNAISFTKSLTNPGAMALALVDLFITVAFALAILVVLLLGVAEALGLLLIGPFLFAVGVAFGPIMIAGLATPWTRDYFTKWLQFIVISAGLTGVINVIFVIAAAMMETVGVAKDSNESTAVGLAVMAILMLTINSMISQAPSIASALFPGHIGVSKAGTGAEAAKASKKLKDSFKGPDKNGKGAGLGNIALKGTGKGIVGGVNMASRFASKLRNK